MKLWSFDGSNGSVLFCCEMRFTSSINWFLSEVKIFVQHVDIFGMCLYLFESCWNMFCRSFIKEEPSLQYLRTKILALLNL